MKKIAIVGGGVSGLSTAYFVKKYAAEKGIQVQITIHEAENRVGGKIKSEIIDGFLCEWGPHAIFLNKPQNIEVIGGLGIQNDVIPTNPSAKKRFIFFNNELQLVPDNPPAFIKSKLLPFSAKLRVLREPWTKPAPPGKDESIAEFAGRHLGQAVVDRMIDPMVTGVFAGDHTKLSVKSSFPVMLELEKEGSGSLFRAMIRRMRAKKKAQKEKGAPAGQEKPTGMNTSNLGSFKSGLEGLSDALKNNLSGEIIANSNVSTVVFSDGRFIITDESGRETENDAIVVAIPAYSAAKVLQEIRPDIVETLDSIPYVPVNIINFGYDKSNIEHPVDGFGFVIPSSEKRKILGSVWMSSIFDHCAPQDKILLRNMVGGVRRPDMAELDDTSTVKTVQEELNVTMGIKADPNFVNIIRHEKAVPQYLIGHLDKVEKIEDSVSKIPGLFITGNAYRGVSIHDCVTNSKKTAQKLIDKIIS